MASKRKLEASSSSWQRVSEEDSSCLDAGTCCLKQCHVWQDGTDDTVDVLVEAFSTNCIRMCSNSLLAGNCWAFSEASASTMDLWRPKKKGQGRGQGGAGRRAGADLASQPCAGEGGSSAAYILASFVVAFSGSFSSLVYQPLQAHSLCSLLRLEPFQA